MIPRAEMHIQIQFKTEAFTVFTKGTTLEEEN